MKISAKIVKSTAKAYQLEIQYWCSIKGGVKSMTRWMPKCACTDNNNGTFDVWDKFVREAAAEFKAKYHNMPNFDLTALDMAKEQKKREDEKAHALTVLSAQDTFNTAFRDFMRTAFNNIVTIDGIHCALTGKSSLGEKHRIWLDKRNVCGANVQDILAMSEREAFLHIKGLHNVFDGKNINMSDFARLLLDRAKVDYPKMDLLEFIAHNGRGLLDKNSFRLIALFNEMMCRAFNPVYEMLYDDIFRNTDRYTRYFKG